MWLFSLQLSSGFRVFIGCADELLQNFFTHIRKLPHFDTRFGVAQARCGSPQKRAFCKCPGKSIGAFYLDVKTVQKGIFLVQNACQSGVIF